MEKLSESILSIFQDEIDSLVDRRDNPKVTSVEESHQYDRIIFILRNLKTRVKEELDEHKIP